MSGGSRVQALQEGDDDGLTGRFLRTFGAPVVSDTPPDDAAQTLHDGSDEPWSESESSDVDVEAPVVIARVFGAPDPADEFKASEPVVEQATPAQADSGTDPDAASEVVSGATSAFSTELTDAMHAVARAQRDRMLEEARDREAVCVDAARSRAADEIDGARTEADASSAEIEAWAASEIQRIEAERGERLAIVRRSLDDRLARHDSLLEREIEAIAAGASAHREELEAFFSRLETEHDPVAIAGMAARMPAPPRLDEIGSEARRRAMVPDAVLPSADDGADPGTFAGEDPVPATDASAWEPAAPEATDPAWTPGEPARAWAAADGRDRTWSTEDTTTADPGTRGPDAVPAEMDEAVMREPATGAVHSADEAMPEPLPAAEADAPAPWGAPSPVDQPAPSTTKPADLIFDRLRMIAERRATMGDSGQSGWATGSATPFRR